MNSYLGINGYILLGFVVLNYLILLTEDRSERILRKLRLAALYLFIMSGFYLYYLVRFHMDSSSQDLLMRELFYKWKMGTVGTYLFYMATTSEYLYAIMGGLAFLLLLIISFFSIREIRIARRKHRKRKLEKKKEMELETQRAIKEQLQKVEKEKLEKVEKAKDEEIRNMVDKIFPNGVPENYNGEKLDTQI